MASAKDKISAAKELENARAAAKQSGPNATKAQLDRIRAAEKAYDKLKHL